MTRGPWVCACSGRRAPWGTYEMAGRPAAECLHQSWKTKRRWSGASKVLYTASLAAQAPATKWSFLALVKQVYVASSDWWRMRRRKRGPVRRRRSWLIRSTCTISTPIAMTIGGARQERRGKGVAGRDVAMAFGGPRVCACTRICRTIVYCQLPSRAGLICRRWATFDSLEGPSIPGLGDAGCETQPDRPWKVF